MLTMESNSADELEKLKKQIATWRTSWSEAMSMGGKMWWDGATWGYTQALKNSSAYHVDARVSETARDVSVLIDVARKTTGAADVVRAYESLEPLTFFVVKYSTGDQILFQYVAGTTKVVRIKTHDGLFMDTDGQLIKAPQAELFKRDER